MLDQHRDESLPAVPPYLLLKAASFITKIAQERLR